MGQSSSTRTTLKLSGELQLPYDVLWQIICDLDGQSLRNVSILNSNINETSNARLWRTFTIDYDYDYITSGERRRDIQTRCIALTRNPTRASYVRSLVIQWDGPLGSYVGRSARSTCKLVSKALLVLPRLEELKTHACAHGQILAQELSARAHRYPFKLKRLTTSLSIQHGFAQFLSHQPEVVFFEASRHERLKGGTFIAPKEDIPSTLMPALRVIYTSGHRAYNLLAQRVLHTVEITNLATPSGYVELEPTAQVEHLCVNFDMFVEQLPSYIRYWGIIPSSLRYLHVNATFPQFSVFPQILSSLGGLEGLEWSAKRKTSSFPRPAGFVLPPSDYYPKAVRECSECCPTLSTIVFVSWTEAKVVWRAGGIRRRWERSDEAESRPTIHDGSGKRWHLVSSDEYLRRSRLFPLIMPQPLHLPANIDLI